MMDGLNLLEGKGAVVTGGGRGIGAAIARHLARNGAGVVVAARTEEEINAVAVELRDDGLQAWPWICDVTDPEAVERMAEAAVERLGQVDILVNNAGVAISAPLHAQSLEGWNRMMAVNATGTFLVTRALAPPMAERGWGRVVNIASTAARTGNRYVSAYAASKHAVLGFTRCVAAELAEAGVTVNAVCPGYVDSDMTRQTVERIVAKTGMGRDEALASILRDCPQRRLIEPSEVAHAVLMLCHDSAGGITGQAVGIDGGKLLA